MASRRPAPRDSEEAPPEENAEGQVEGYEESGEDFSQEDPDVLLDVPRVSVEELSLEVEDLQARVALRARLSELLQIDVGIDVSLSEVKLETKGVEAEAQLKARLKNVNDMIQRTLSSIDDNPELVKDLTDMAGTTARGRDSAPKATEAARKKAEELGVDLSTIRGTGSGGRVILRDVRRSPGGP